MRISAKVDYACKALLELSMRWPDNMPVQVSVISKNQKIPEQYLVQILISLKGMNLVKSIRGKEGGYCLLKSPSEISIKDVYSGIGGQFLPLSDSAKKKSSVFFIMWDNVDRKISEMLSGITFDEVVQKAKGLTKTINYQI